jgi:hypothetical protein
MDKPEMSSPATSSDRKDPMFYRSPQKSPQLEPVVIKMTKNADTSPLCAQKEIQSFVKTKNGIYYTYCKRN